MFKAPPPPCSSREIDGQAANVDEPADPRKISKMRSHSQSCPTSSTAFEVIFLKDDSVVESGKRSTVNRFQRTYNGPPNSSLETSSTHLYLQYPETSIKPLSSSYSHPDNSLYRSNRNRTRQKFPLSSIIYPNGGVARWINK